MRRQYAILTSVELPQEPAAMNEKFLRLLYNALLLALMERGLLTQQQYRHTAEKL